MNPWSAVGRGPVVEAQLVEPLEVEGERAAIPGHLDGEAVLPAGREARRLERRRARRRSSRPVKIATSSTVTSPTSLGRGAREPGPLADERPLPHDRVDGPGHGLHGLAR